jgi:hypothetical protein
VRAPSLHKSAAFEQTLRKYKESANGNTCTIAFHLRSENPMNRNHPSFAHLCLPTFDWSNAFMQRKGTPLLTLHQETIYSITALHCDNPSSGAWGVIIKGRKRFYFVPPSKQKIIYEHMGVSGQVDYFTPIFTTEERIQIGREYGVLSVTVEKGDTISFPSHWPHEVHNLEPDTLSLTNSFLNPFYFEFLPDLKSV